MGKMIDDKVAFMKMWDIDEGPRLLAKTKIPFAICLKYQTLKKRVLHGKVCEQNPRRCCIRMVGHHFILIFGFVLIDYLKFSLSYRLFFWRSYFKWKQNYYGMIFD